MCWMMPMALAARLAKGPALSVFTRAPHFKEALKAKLAPVVPKAEDVPVRPVIAMDDDMAA